MDQAGINMILVGDSLGMTMQGYSDTLPVTLEEMILWAAAWPGDAGMPLWFWTCPL